MPFHLYSLLCKKLNSYLQIITHHQTTNEIIECVWIWIIGVYLVIGFWNLVIVSSFLSEPPDSDLPILHAPQISSHPSQTVLRRPVKN